MAGEVVVITGIEEVQRMLTEAPKNIVMLGYGRALNAGINVLATAIIARTPVKKGDLAKALVTNVVVDSQGRGGHAEVGFSGKQGHVANWLEYGHVMRGHRPKRKLLGTVAPHPFMRRAADTAGDAAVEAFADSLAATLKQEY
jgi:hypothetical protein